MTDTELQNATNAIDNLNSIDDLEGARRVGDIVCPLFSKLPQSKVINVLLSVFERFPNEEKSRSLWDILHMIEKSGSYHSQLFESVRRQPAHFTVKMLTKMLNSGIETVDEVDLRYLLEEVAGNAHCSDRIRARAESDLRRYFIWKRGVRTEDIIERIIGKTLKKDWI